VARKNFSKLIALCFILVAFGCASKQKKIEKNNLLFTDKDIAGIFDTYQKDANKAKAKRKAMIGAKIRRLEVIKDAKKKEFFVSADLNNAPLNSVIITILNESKTQYFLKDVAIVGSVSGRFEKMPFLRAVNILLNSQGYSASFSEEKVLFIEEGVPEKPVAVKKKPASPPKPASSPQSFRRNDNKDGMPAQFSARFRRASLLIQDPPAEGAPAPPAAEGDPAPPAAEGAPAPPAAEGAPAPPAAEGAPAPPAAEAAPAPTAEGEAPPAAAKKPPDPEITVEHSLANLSVKSANQVLTKLFPGGGEGEGAAAGGSVLFSVEETRNTVIIKGKRSQVQKVKRVLRTIDRSPQHVLIEVLVLEVDSDALEELNVGITDYASKRYSGLATAIGVEGSNTLTAIYNNVRRGEVNSEGTALGFTANLKFTGIAKLLFKKDLARIIARPYLASLTGKESVLQITEDRSIVVSEGNASSTKEISSGVSLKITPTVHLSGVIEMSVDVEQSGFIPTTGNVATSKDTNKATTIMQVPSGQSIIIGGLMFNSRSASNAGLPWLRRIPFLNLFTSSRQRTHVDKEVLIVVTPHLYSPGLRTPLPWLKVFQKPVDRNLLRTTPSEMGDTKQY